MNINISRIKRSLRRIEALMLAALVVSTSLSYMVSASENSSEQEMIIEEEEEPEQGGLESTEIIKAGKTEAGKAETGKTEAGKTEAGKVETGKTETGKTEAGKTEAGKAEAPKTETEISGQNVGVKAEDALDTPYVEYSAQTDVDGYTIKLEAYNGVFPEGEDISLLATQIDDQDILDAIDSKLSEVCEGDFKQVSFDIKVVNAVGEELQPDRSNYIENEDIIPIQLSIELANAEIDGELEVFHFADDLSSMECLVSTVDGDEITVEPEHFSVFTILESNNDSVYKNLPKPTGYRTYIEWMPNSTAGLRRLQKIYVYAKAGEQISFGSSSFVNLKKGEVEKSLADSFGQTTVGLAPSDASIAVTLPYYSEIEDPHLMQEAKGVNYSIYNTSAVPSAVIAQIEGSTTYHDNHIYLFKKDEIADVTVDDPLKTSIKGTIYNWQQETLGPSTINAGGYVPLSFRAPVTGVYTFRFFGTQYTKVETAIKAKKTDEFPQKSKNYVGAWDITVTDTAAPTTPITGRTFTDALIWTIGANVSTNEHIMDESAYALTKDGFEYKVDFNGMDPFGFVFYTNKRGLLVSSDDHEDGHYRSLARSVKSKRNQLDDLIEMGVHLNSIPTEPDKDESYFITFEKADSELLKHYTGYSALTDKGSMGTNPDAYKNFNFTGLNSGTAGIGTEGYGGYFSFDYDMSSELTDKRILPSTYEIIINFTGNKTLEAEYGYAAGKHNEVILSNTLVGGTNRIFWDGKDEYGNVVIGSDAGIEYDIVSFNVKAGEVHFPLLDVENNRYGIKVEMQNGISGIDASNIYYDNSDSDVYGKNIGDMKEKLTGVSSASGAMAFGGNAGDFSAIDIWADYRIDTPIHNYKFKLFGLNNANAFFTAKTAWQYYYSTMDGKEHFDSTPLGSLPKTAEVELQYRIVNKSTVGIGGVNTDAPNWQVDDTGAGKDWKIYSGPVTVSLQYGKDDTDVNEKSITLNPSAPNSFGKLSSVGEYKSVTIESYIMVDNEDPLTKTHYPKEASDGLCTFKGLPLHPETAPGVYDQSIFYQYRVVDKNNSSLKSYVKDEIFDRVAAVDIPEGAGHVTKDIYLEETLDYRFRGAEEFNLEFDQLWNDSGMTTEWRNTHRPTAVRVAILYGVPLYEDTDKSSEYDITTEKGYYGEDVKVVWRNVQKIKYLTLHADGVSCTDNNGVSRKLELVEASNGSYAAYFPVGKYMSNGDPYFYKIRPVSYSMDGLTFTPVEYWDDNEIVPKLALPEFYGIDDSNSFEVEYPNKYRVVFYDENEISGDPKLYPKAVKFTDLPAKAEIELTKTDTSNNPIIGKSTSYVIKNKAGKNLMFTLDSEGTYIYEGVEETVGLPDTATSVLKTSTGDSIVHANGLPLNDYSIHEVKAPEGYQLSTKSIDIIIQDFLSESSMVDKFKIYTCKRTQKDSTIPDPSSAPWIYGNKDANIFREINLLTNTNGANNNSINSKKLPKTGGLTGSLMAMALGVFMIGFGVYLTSPLDKQKNNRG